MSKALLTLEMPSDCVNCPLSTQILNKLICQYTGLYGTEKERPDWCPLHEMPEPMYLQCGDYMEYNEGCVDGWNNCLAELEGKHGKSNFSISTG